MDNDGIRDGDILDEWTNGERKDTTFSINFGPCRINPRWPTWSPNHDAENGTIILNSLSSFLTFRRRSGDLGKGCRWAHFLLIFSPLMLGGKLLIPTRDSRCFPLLFSVRQGTERETGRAVFGDLRCDEDKNFFFLQNKRAIRQFH